MNSVTTTAGGFDKVIFESVIDTLAGGASLDTTGYTNTDNIIPAGTMVGPKNASTGLHTIVTVDAAGAFTGGTPIGLVHATVPFVASGNNVVGVVLKGTYRPAALPAVPTTAAIGTMKTAMPGLVAAS
jgi:hypothetical protein